MGEKVGQRTKIICHSCLRTFGYRRTSGPIKCGAKIDGMHPSGVRGCILVVEGDIKVLMVIGMCFLLRGGQSGRKAAMVG